MGELSDLNLWNRINSFQLDKADTTLPFSARLARENGWDEPFARQVCDEYKKYIYLACISPDIVTPSEQVDAAWHLHLVYTKSYWQDFCRDALERDLHHTPTEGGPDETTKFRGAYQRALELYEQEFGALPPPDIWPPVEQRFVLPASVGPQTHYIVDKQKAHLAGASLVAATGSSAFMMLGVPVLPALFLGFICFLLIGAFVAPSIIKPSKDSSGGCGSGCGGCG